MKKRVYMRNLVEIGQTWNRKCDGCPVVIRNVHRRDELVEAREGSWFSPLRLMIPFRVLRKDYRLIEGRKSPWLEVPEAAEMEQGTPVLTRRA